jgi:hypothetical protein
MKRAWMVLGLFVLLMPVIDAVTAAASAGLNVTICHRTGSASNPFNVISPSNTSIIEAHIGPIAHPPKNGNPDLLLGFAGGTEADCVRCDNGDGCGGPGGGDGGGDGSGS